MKKTKSTKKLTNIFLLILCFGIASTPLCGAAPPPGTTTAPYTISYSAKLTTSSGTPVTTPQNIRFSIWSDSDSDSSDYLQSGAINPSAGGFTGWQETHSVTPDANGLFHIRLGTVSTLPNLSASTQMFMEIDVKNALLPDTAYEVLDPDADNAAGLNDRHPFNSSAYAINADTVDNRDAGAGAGNIPVLDGAGHLAIGTMPGGTNADSFVLDSDNTVTPPSTISLKFGAALNKTLSYAPSEGWFNFSDDVNVSGNLTVTGTINGATVSTGTVGPYSQSLAYEPEYPGMIMQGDGTNNQGKLEIFFADTDGVPGNNNYNYYKWTTRQTSLQDMDLTLRVTLPEGFTSFTAAPLKFTYRTENTNTSLNRIDLSMEDTGGAAVQLNQASALASASWTTANITFSGSPTFTPGQAITIKIKQSASSGGATYVGKLTLNYTGR